MLHLNHLPANLRPRERCLAVGAAALSLEELIAVIVGTGTAKTDVLSLSTHLAQKLVGGARSVAELTSLAGVGQVKAVELLAALELERAVIRRSSSSFLSESLFVYQRMADLLSQPQEHLVVFSTTSRGQELNRSTVTVGTATASLVHAREVFRPAITANAAHIVVAHTHPSGNPTPSQADKQVTRELVEAGRLLGIELLDHVVCATSGFVSLRQEFPELFSW